MFEASKTEVQTLVSQLGKAKEKYEEIEAEAKAAKEKLRQAEEQQHKATREAEAAQAELKKLSNKLVSSLHGQWFSRFLDNRLISTHKKHLRNRFLIRDALQEKAEKLTFRTKFKKKLGKS